MESQATQVTHLLRAWSGGDSVALEQLMPLVYEELRRMARRYMQRERQGNTLQATALVNEAFLRQSAFSEIDRVCSPARQGAMMREIGRFIDLAERAQAAGIHPDRIAHLDCVRALQRMGEEIPDSELTRFDALEAAMEREFTDLAEADEASHATHG